MWNLTSLYKYDNSIFDEIVLPNGMDRTLCLNRIMWRCGLEQPIYGEPDVFKSLTGIFFQVHQYEIQKMWDALHQEYNPIENYDRNTEGNRTTKRDYTNKNYAGTDRTENVKDNTNSLENIRPNTTTTNSGTDTTTNNVAAYNSSEYSPNEQQKLEHGHIIQNTGTTDDEIIVERTLDTTGKDVTNTVGSGDSNNNEGYKEHVHGNIGVTTSQQMIQSEIELYKNNNIYDWIANRFEDEMMITVW